MANSYNSVGSFIAEVEVRCLYPSTPLRYAQGERGFGFLQRHPLIAQILFIRSMIIRHALARNFDDARRQ